ncbi:MAG: aminopeptidase P family protein [Clostridiaceae bacterium]|nr:aminopeptidase P family protein [Clostridiaceae bacterium]
MQKRIEKVREILKDKNLDGIFIYKPQNRKYFSGFTGTTGYVLITQDEAKFFTDFRYMEQAKEECSGYDIVEISRFEPLTNKIQELPLNRLGVEEEYYTFKDFTQFKSKLEKLEIIALEGALTEVRAIKSSDEIKYIEKAASIADEAFTYILEIIKPGVTEKEIALELEFFMRKKGASGGSFSFIVASGVRSSLPHGVASDKIIQENDMVTLDYGCIYEGYCSDMTRTIVVGKANDKQKEIYSIVLEAQIKALESVKPGITGKALDEIARTIITDKGYGECFGHGLGHGLGLEVHELPHVNYIGDAPIEAGMILTIEPGIYVPGFGGVRIEDLVLVTDTDYKVLSKTPKELIEIKI